MIFKIMIRRRRTWHPLQNHHALEAIDPRVEKKASDIFLKVYPVQAEAGGYDSRKLEPRHPVIANQPSIPHSRSFIAPCNLLII
jgi:hypothetical protein